MSSIPQILRWPQVHIITGRSRSQAWRDERAGQFPRRIRIGPNAVGWRSDQILAWVQSRPVVGQAFSVERGPL